MAGLDPDGRIARESLQLDVDYFRQQGYYTGPITLDNLLEVPPSRSMPSSRLTLSVEGAWTLGARVRVYGAVGGGK